MAACMLCPRHCGADREKQAGFCGCDSRIRVARCALHHWEEPCISGTRGAGTIFFSGCNLRCVYCQNHLISQEGMGFPVTLAQLGQMARDLIGQGAHNIELVTPTQYSDQIAEFLQTPLPVPVVWNSGGYDSVSQLRALEGKVQIYLPDLKYISSDTASLLSAAPDYPEVAVNAIEEMIRQRGPLLFDEEGILQSGVWVRHLVLPGHIRESLQLIDFFADRFGGRCGFSLMSQYTPCGEAAKYPPLGRRLTRREYERCAERLLSRNLEYANLQAHSSAKEEYIPPFDGTGVPSDSEW